MNQTETEGGPGEVRVDPPRPGIRLGDILYVLFRHKWKIALVCCAGMGVAMTLPFVTPRVYKSEAKLFIRYVLESKSPGQIGANDSRIKSPDERGENVINTEMEILTSLDVAQQVANIIGADKILGKGAGGTNAAAELIRKNLSAEVPKKSNVICVTFQHTDPDIVQPVLKQIIDSYFKKHAEIHRSVGVFDEFLLKETDELRTRLVTTEEDLRKAKANAHVTSVEDTKKLYTEQISKVRQDILSAEAELAERRAAATEMAKLLPAKPVAATNDVPATNSVAVGSSAAATNDVPVPGDRIAEYRKVGGLLEALGKKEQELLLQFTTSNSMVGSVQEQIAAQRQVKQQLEEQYPALLAVKAAEPRAASGEPVVPSARSELATELVKVTALQSKVKFLTGQLEKISKDATGVYEAEGSITELQRKKDLEEAEYKYFAQNLEQSRIDEALGATRESNISRIQAPSPPYRAASKLVKMMASAFFGAIAGALGLAVVVEFYLDQSVKRPAEVEPRFRLPLFISIPYMNGHRKVKGLKSVKKTKLLPQTTAADTTPHPALRTPHSDGSAADTTPHSALRAPHPEGSALNPQLPPITDDRFHPFYDALRDRLITYFEVKGLTHKPKLVAVTSCGEGAGVSTIASGLAASLSETGDGNVLLVDMNLEQGAAHPFCRGKLACGLDDALTTETRSNAQVEGQGNLYVVTESTNHEKLPRVLPKRFTNLVPKLKASDYDYIIFDMPPVSQVSVTPRLARFMDMVLTVVESEKTDREAVQSATGLLIEAGADVGIVLNKRRKYVPRFLHQEL